MMYRSTLDYRVKKLQKSKRLTFKGQLLVKPPLALEKVVYRGALLTIELAVIYLLPAFLVGDVWPPFPAAKLSAPEVTLALMQCLLGAIGIQIPMLLARLTRIRLPGALCALFYVFVLGATVLGEVFSFYYLIPVWDSILHAGSGAMLGMLGGILMVCYFHKKGLGQMASPLFVAVGAVCFALCVGVCWEIYEFCADSWLGLNMQKAMLQDGTALLGGAALGDTMKDLIVDFAGALLAAASAFVSLKQKKGWLYSYLA